jgi:nucleoid-associated protein YgaU
MVKSHFYLKQIIKFTYAQQWRIWAVLVAVVFAFGVIFGFVVPEFSGVSRMANRVSTPELFGTLSLESSQPTLELGGVNPSNEVSTLRLQPTQPSSAELSEKSNLYTVQPGDSLWKLAEDWFGDGYRYVQIAQANSLPISTRLEVGQQLRQPTGPDILPQAWQSDGPNKIPTIIAPVVDRQLTSPVSGPMIAVADFRPYTIQPGDSLWSIAQAQRGTGSAWRKIYEDNRQRLGENPGLIYPGAQLLLPPAAQTVESLVK